MQSGLYSPDIPLVSGELDISSTGDKHSFGIPFKCRVVRAGVTIVNDIGATGVIKFDSRQGTTRADGDVATINLATSHTEGECVYDDAGASLELEEGDQVIVEVTDAAAASDEAIAFLVVRQVPETAANNSKMVETT